MKFVSSKILLLWVLMLIVVVRAFGNPDKEDAAPAEDTTPNLRHYPHHHHHHHHPHYTKNQCKRYKKRCKNANCAWYNLGCLAWLRELTEVFALVGKDTVKPYSHLAIFLSFFLSFE